MQAEGRKESQIMAGNPSKSPHLGVAVPSTHRRRSVHFDSSPTEIGSGGGGGVAPEASRALPREQQAIRFLEEDEEEEEGEDEGETAPPAPAPQSASSFDPKLALRRQSAPAATIALDLPSPDDEADKVLTKMGKALARKHVSYMRCGTQRFRAHLLFRLPSLLPRARAGVGLKAANCCDVAFSSLPFDL